MESLKLSILKALYFSSIQSIAEISERIGKSVPLVTRGINELLTEGWIVNCGPRASTGGRRASGFSLNVERHGCIIAVAMDQYSISATAFSLDNRQLLTTQTVEAQLWEASKAYESTINLINDVLNKLSEKEVISIGITMPGFVHSANGVNTSFPKTSPLYSLATNVQDHFGIQTYIENDSSAIAIAEKNFGHIKEIADSLVINLNWGVGLGIIVQHQLFRGHSGFAGEFSHIPLADENKLCSCGKKGCLEVEASLLSAVEYIVEALANGERSFLEQKYAQNKRISFKDVFEAYQKGDQVTIVALKKIAHMLGKGIATLIHILNPETIVISGKGAAFSEVLFPQIQSSIQEYCIPRLSKYTTIQISEINNIQLLASTCIAIQQMQWTSQKQTINT